MSYTKPCVSNMNGLCMAHGCMCLCTDCSAKIEDRSMTDEDLEFMEGLSEEEQEEYRRRKGQRDEY